MLGKDSKAYGQIQSCIQPLLQGVVVCIDPSIGSTSSMPGYAVYIKGELKDSGIFTIDPTGTVWQRLHVLAYSLRKLYQKWDPDVLVFEDILPQAHGRDAASHASLLKAVGAILSVSGPDHYVGLLPISWKKMTRDTYVKGDEADAIEIGYIALEEARRISQVVPPAPVGSKPYGRGPRKEKKAPTPGQ